MKLKNIILAAAVAPIVGLILVEVLWRVYDFANLIMYLSVTNYSDLTLIVFSVTWLGIAYKSLKTGIADKKHAKKRKQTVSLNKEITLKDVSETLKPTKKSALLEFIIIGAGKNLHQVVPYKADEEYKAGETIYKVENANLMVQRGFMGRKKYTAIFKENGDAVKVEGGNGKVTAEILSLAQRSGALGRTIKEMFSTHLDMKKILFFVVLGVVAVVAFLIISGGIL